MRNTSRTFPAAASVIHRVGLSQLMMLTACGGGSSAVLLPAQPLVSSIMLSAPRYRQVLTISIAGTGLESGFTVSSSNCRDLERIAAVPPSSNATSAHFRCTPALFGQGRIDVVRDSDGLELAASTFDLPLPEVTLYVSNGADVFGKVVILLRPDKKPFTVNHFLDFVDSGYYVGTILDYVFPDFAIQGGGYLPYTPQTVPVRKPAGDSVGDENDRWNKIESVKWTVSTASEYRVPQVMSMFTINLSDLPTGVTPFGSVIAGQDVIEAIAHAPCEFVPYFARPACLPVPNVVITDVVQTR